MTGVRWRSPAVRKKILLANRWLVLLACLIALGGLIRAVVVPGADTWHIARMTLIGAAWVVFGVAAWLVRKVALKPAVGLILAAGIGLQVIAFSAPPAHSTDMYRYMWDGQVQSAGIDPYLYPPSAAGLAHLRNDFLWAPFTSTPGHSIYHYCVLDTVNREGPAFDQATGCSKINRTNSPTIYPPVAEAWFTAVYLVAGDNSTTPMQVAMALCAVLTTLVLLFGLRRLGRDPRLAALWAWCPTAILEVGNDAHADVLGVLLTAIALLVLARARTEGKAMLGGALLGLALATKLTPIFTFPGVLKRAWQHILVAAVAATAIVYAPHVMAVGSKVIGFFPGYLQQQGYSNGTGYSIIGLFVHGKLASLAAFIVMGIVGLAVLRYSNPDRPWRGGVVMMAAALAVGTPEFEWYSMLLVVLVALDGRAEWLALCAGAYLANDGRLSATLVVPDCRVVGYGGGLAIALAVTLIRYAPHSYRMVTRRAFGERHWPLRPSMEVCDTRTPSTASGRHGMTQTPVAPAVTAQARPVPSGRLASSGQLTSSGAMSPAATTTGAAVTTTRPAWTPSAPSTPPPSTAISTE
jgi:Glycosyltransferase family 87